MRNNFFWKATGFSTKEKLSFATTVLLMVPLFFAAKGAFSSLAQTENKNQKFLTKESFKNEPVEFVSIESDGQPVRPNEKFERTGEWLNGLTFKIRNVSGKPIVYLAIVLLFPETGRQEPPKVYFLKYGVNPLTASMRVNVRQTEEPRLLAPEDTAELRLSPVKFKALREFMAQNWKIEDLTEMNYRIGAVFFEDGTQWSAGSYLRPDPDAPGRFIPFEKKTQEEK